ncbi:MAG: hypothetical protein GTO24_23410 [candidate division Zixibacteria bacterium]|nr:hypothetical protein [candidate division Zixibacteria bacterium]
MKKSSLFFVVIFALVSLPAWAMAGTVEGTVQGLTCIALGKLCPVDKEDPMIAAERIFVVLTKDNNYYFVPNLDRAILARHINQRVKVIGKISPKYKAIHAEELQVFQNNAWKTAWSTGMQRELYEWLGPF